ncbi:MAG: RnfABCDGE type electron transport complex subunit D [Bryobacteraceae bacterium]|jgi:Na+-translocating ferredoxin:NAD+ oxidoreductase RnfD subunit
MTASQTWTPSNRLAGLRRFAAAITLLNILGHTVFGFEQSWAQPLVSLAAAYSMEILLELVGGRRRAWLSRGTIDFLLPAHITALAVAMLLYANDRLWPIAFASAAAIGSKAIFRIGAGPHTRHFFNPSNFGITVTLLLFPWVGIAPPYHFTENLVGVGSWILPGVIVFSGAFLNARFTHKLPLIGAWLGGFALQALIRSWWFGTPPVAAWLPMTGVAFLLYTFYMVTDPATSPGSRGGQIFFGLAVALAYGILMMAHVVFGLFFSLTLVCALRGGVLWWEARRSMAQRGPSEGARAEVEWEAVAAGSSRS